MRHPTARGLLLCLFAMEAAGDVWMPGPAAPSDMKPNPAASMVLDTVRNRVVMFDGDGSPRTVWEFDGMAWTRGAVPPQMGILGANGSSFDRGRGVTVISGGGTAETWEYDGMTWRRGVDFPGTPRLQPSMAYHVARGKTVLFGGGAGALFNIHYRDTWEYDGTTWTLTVPEAAAPMSARSGAGLVDDEARAVLVLFGGHQKYSSFNDTWLYDGTWRAGPAPPAGLGPQWNPGMAYVGGNVVMVGVGGNGQADTWVYDGAAWMTGPAPPSELSVGGSPMCATPGSGAVMFGDVAFCGRYMTRTWLYAACPTISVGPATLPAAAPGSAYAVTLTATGGAAPYSFDVIEGRLPPGITLSPAGSLSGTPLLEGTFVFRVRAVDVVGCSASTTFPVRVGGPANLIAGEGGALPSGNRVRLFSTSGSQLLELTAYGAGQWGVNVAVGNVDGGAAPEIVAGPGPGPVYGPHVRAFDNQGAALPVSFYAYGTLKYGASVGAGRIDGDVYAEILTAPGPGGVFGPHVRAWDYDGSAVRPVADVSFFAYGTLKFGANVAGGDLEADGFDEIATGPGPGLTFAAHVRAFDHDGAGLRVMALNTHAFGAPISAGVFVAAGSIDGDDRDDVLCGAGARATITGQFDAYRYTGWGASRVPWVESVAPLGTYGSRVGSVDIDDDGSDELLAGAGPDPSMPADVHLWRYGCAPFQGWTSTISAFPGLAYGVNVSGGLFGR